MSLTFKIAFNLNILLLGENEKINTYNKLFREHE